MDELAHEQFARLEREHFWFRGRRRLAAALVRQACEGREVRTALDLGCGSGGMLQLLAGRGARVVGLEPQAQTAARADGRFGARVLRGDGHRLPFADDSFDTVMGSFVLCSAEHPVAPPRIDSKGTVVATETYKILNFTKCGAPPNLLFIYKLVLQNGRN